MFCFKLAIGKEHYISQSLLNYFRIVRAGDMVSSNQTTGSILIVCNLGEK